MKKRIVVLTQVFMLLLSLVVFVPVESMESLSINAPSQVDEGEDFQVTVTVGVGGDPIEGAEVIWQGERYLTNSDGIVDLTAPLVYESGYHTICAEHPEYITDCLTPGIEVIDIGNLPLNIVLEPSSVIEGENFVVTVTSSSDPVYNVTITVGWGTPWGSNLTDKNGQVTLTATSVSEDTTYSINASKTGYFNETANIVVLDEMQTLTIHVDISIVLEGVPFQVRVTADDRGVDRVLVTFNDHGYYTNESGEVTILAPIVEQNTIYSIEASKSGYEGNEIQIIVMDSSTTLPALVIDSPTSVSENQSFLVTIRSEEYTQPIEGVTVTFNDKSYSTNDDGEVNFTAPSVGDTTNYVITANKTGYIDAGVTITILNVGELEPPEPVDGWILGTVTNESGVFIKDVLVCIVITYEANKCAYSGEDGMYTIFASAGTYSVQASKDGYVSKTQEAIILTDESTELNFILQEEEIPLEPSIDVSAQLIEEKIKKEIGKIGAKINVDGGQSVVSYFSDEIKIKLDIDKDIICIINASEGTPGTILVFQIEESDISSFKEDITVKFDGEILNEVNDVEAFFNLQENTESCWLQVLTLNGLYVFVRVQHFSEHTITISSIAEEVVETIINITAVSLYIVIIVVLAVVTVIPIVRLWKKIE